MAKQKEILHTLNRLHATPVPLLVSFPVCTFVLCMQTSVFFLFFSFFFSFWVWTFDSLLWAKRSYVVKKSKFLIGCWCHEIHPPNFPTLFNLVVKE